MFVCFSYKSNFSVSSSGQDLANSDKNKTRGFLYRSTEVKLIIEPTFLCCSKVLKYYNVLQQALSFKRIFFSRVSLDEICNIVVSRTEL